jgi:4-hydroxy-tetrahydrodipicolinate synthase
MAATSLRGIVPAVVTPFDDDGKIDYEAWRGHIGRLIAAGVHGLFVMGGQGEFFALTEEEREVAARFAIQEAAGRTAVYVNIGAVTTRQTVDLAQKAEADGADYLVAITPYYVRPSADELVAHYVELCRSVAKPALAYNIPERTGVELNPRILERIAAQCENFVGLKDSSGKLDLIAAYREARLAVFVGRDHMVLDGLKLGAVGAVSACANVVPRAFVEMYEAFQAGDRERAARMQALVEPLRRAFNLGTFPAVVKEAMNLAGLGGGVCRLPVGPLAAPAREQLARVVEDLRAAGYLPVQNQ